VICLNPAGKVNLLRSREFVFVAMVCRGLVQFAVEFAAPEILLAARWHDREGRSFMIRCPRLLVAPTRKNEVCRPASYLHFRLPLPADRVRLPPSLTESSVFVPGALLRARVLATLAASISRVRLVVASAAVDSFLICSSTSAEPQCISASGIASMKQSGKPVGIRRGRATVFIWKAWCFANESKTSLCLRFQLERAAQSQGFV
jgi:hypothetical protein